MTWTQHSMLSHVRYESKYEVGDRGAVYEFDIKLPLIRAVDIDNDSFEIEASHSIRAFVAELKRRYTWIGDVYQTGRSGGWLAVEDKKGLATKAKLKTIVGLVEQAKSDFVRMLKEEYPA